MSQYKQTALLALEELQNHGLSGATFCSDLEEGRFVDTMEGIHAQASIAICQLDDAISAAVKRAEDAEAAFATERAHFSRVSVEKMAVADELARESLLKDKAEADRDRAVGMLRIARGVMVYGNTPPVGFLRNLDALLAEIGKA